MNKIKDSFTRLLEKLGLPFLIILSGFLNVYRLWDLSYGNGYYAAAIKSMLTSFSNFFFVSLDSTGFISVDKSPLSLWVDALFARVFGFSGFSILLPHAIEGVLVTILTYIIVKKMAGKIPGFIAALVITLSPVNVAVYRNNTPDALLLVFMLLAIYFVMKFFDKNKLRYVIAAAAMVGLGFNTKMLQAFLILPALTGAILLFSKGNFLQRLKPLALFLVVTAVVSFSWITAVDLTPAANRPYVGSSTNNSAWDLAFNYNGAQRLEGENGVGGRAGFNVGQAGLTRLFTGEMGTQTGWFLVSALAFSGYFIVKNRRKLWLELRGKPSDISLFEILMFLSIAFMATGFVFFSYAGFFHSYYLNIFAVPLALLIGGLCYELYLSGFKNLWLWGALLLSLPMQIFLIMQANYADLLIFLIAAVAIAAVVLALVLRRQLYRQLALSGLLIALLVTPLVWSAYTTFQGNTATAIFIGGPSIRSSLAGFGAIPGFNFQGAGAPDGLRGRDGRFRSGNNQLLPGQNGTGPFNTLRQPGNIPGAGGVQAFERSAVSSEVVAYLQNNYQGEKYFVAVPSANEAEGFILDHNITNVMTLGGFSGRDKAITLDQLQQKIAAGEVRFFYIAGERAGGLQQFQDGNTYGRGQGGGMFNANSDITSYVTGSCQSVNGLTGLYDCSAQPAIHINFQ